MLENDHARHPCRRPRQPPPAIRRAASIWSALSWVRDLAFSVLIAVILIVFIYQPVKVEGTSMMPTLTDQERIFINKFTYHFGLGSIERGDMVVFWYPARPLQVLHQARHRRPRRHVVRSMPARSIVNGQALNEELRPGGLPRPHLLGRAPRPAGRVLRAGRPPQFLQRQPHLGLRQARRHLRQGRLRLLAAEKDGPPALIEIAWTQAGHVLPE